MILHTLQEIGLNEKEAQLYVLLLELGTQPASVVARKMKIPRSSAQFVANALVEKGFANKMIKNNVTYYTAQPPKVIQEFLQRQEGMFMEEMKEKKEKLHQIDFLLQRVQIKSARLPKVAFYEGVENVAHSYLEFLQGVPINQVIYNYVSPATEEFPQFRAAMIKFIDIRKKNKIFCKTICTYGEDAVKLKITDSKFQRETLITSEQPQGKFFSEMLISSDKILDTSYSQNGLFSSLMENVDIAAMRIAMFQMAWRQVIEEDKKICLSSEIKKWFQKYKNISEYV